ncbi:MAG TPA: double-strand break repair protein AddB [Stellaceae bacterium]|nr:double-strand break repair protein AddB [Stellaceae bacterium]
MAQIYTVPPGRPFLDSLVAGLMARAGDDPVALARGTILLPTRRAARALAEAFLRASAGRPLLLPRLAAVGDLDAEELLLLGDEGESDDALDIAPAIPELRRRLMLARLVLAWGRAQGTGPMTPGQAAPLAAELARFLDEVQAEGGSLDDLARLVPEEHAQHWQKVLAFLDIVRVHWPAALAEIGCLDPAERRNQVLAAQARQWQHRPPPHSVIAAGITGGVPAVADLLEAVAALPQGMIVLPGLARDCDDDTWTQIADDPAHPQHLMARLLHRLAIEPATVRDWPSAGVAGAPDARRTLVFEALRPAVSSDRWRGLAPMPKSAIEGLHRIDCPGPREEALVIALLLRQALETPEATAALVTPDRELARRVAAELRRWNIEIDDSAGVPLNRTPPGIFLRLLLEAAAQDLAPVPLLALLKHPLAACGLAPEACRALARRLEIAVLRGPRPAPGLAGLEAALRETETAHDLGPFVAAIGAALAPLIDAIAARGTSLAHLVEAHVAAAEALACSDTETGAERLWREPAGEAAAHIASELIDAAGQFPALDGSDFPALFEGLVTGPVVRPAFGRHPRLFIWGLLEARLQHADRLILGGLNEGVWPAESESDPFLSRPMRRGFGMPPPERRIGVAAHDFAQALGAREVVLTRATRIEGTPTVPSRWLLRLDAVLTAGGLGPILAAADEPLAWQREIDKSARIASVAPAPRPPLAARPRRLSVTEIETWVRDPYAIYARRVLRLKAIDPLDADPGAADRGLMIHQTLDRFLNAYRGVLPTNAVERLVALGREVFGAALERPGVRAFWWPRFERIARWFVALEAERRAGLAAIAAERKGSLMLGGPGGPFELVGRADRIDVLRAGGLAIADFKTGTLPQRDDVALGYAPQLALEAAMAEAGGFEGVPAAPVAELAFWHLSGGDPAGKVQPIADSPAALRARIDEAVAGVRRLIAEFDLLATPYLSVPRPEKAPRYSDYGHLARVKEWSVPGEGEGGGEE